MNLDFGARIKELRMAKKIQQITLSEHLNVSKSLISAYESGAKVPSVEMLAKLAQFFQVSMDYMYGFVSKGDGSSISKLDYKFDYINASGLLESQRLLVVQLIEEFKLANSIGTSNEEFVDKYDYYINVKKRPEPNDEKK